MDTVSEVRKPSIWRLAIDIGDAYFVGGVILVMLILTTLPYLFGYWSSPANKQFMGIMYDVHDTTQYLSWMRESGSRLFIENKLTSEPNAQIFLNIQWWLLGRLAHYSGMSLFQVYHLFRVLTIIIFLTVCYIFFNSYFFNDRVRSRLALLIVTFGAGLGWVWVVKKQLLHQPDIEFPNDVYTIPANQFLSMLAVPHVAFAASLIVGVLLLALLAYKRGKFGYTLAASCLALFLGMSHIYDLVTVWTVLAVFGLLLTWRDGFSWRVFFNLILIVLVSLPAALYYGYIARFVAVWKEALAQYDNLGTFTPDPFHLVILMGLPLVVALLTFRGVVPLRHLNTRQLFVRGWFIAGSMLIFLPLKFQIMLLNSLQIPIAVLAVEGLLDHVVPWLEERRAGWRVLSRLPLGRLTPILFVAFITLTNLYLLGWRVIDLRRHDYPYYLYRDEVAALRWLEANTNPDDVVLTSLSLGHYLPGLSGNKAFLSSGVMTMNFNVKRQMVDDFFDAAVRDEERRAMIERYDIRYVIYGHGEQTLGPYDPEGSPLFSKVFDAPEASVYRVVPGEE